MTLTVERARKHLRITGTDEDTVLADFVAAANDQLAAHVGPLEPTEVTEKVTATGTGTLVLGTTPVISLTSLTALLTSTLTVSLDVLDVDADTGVVERIDGLPLCGRWTAVYQAGYVTLPSTINLAGLDLILHWWRQSQSHGSVSYGESAGAVTDFSDLPFAVLNKIRPYERILVG